MFPIRPLTPIYVKALDILKQCHKLFNTIIKEDNLSIVTFRLLKYYKIKITLNSIIEYLKSHQNYPSLKSICDLLEELKISFYALRINESELFNLSKPFIAHINEDQGKVVVVYYIDKDTVIYTDTFHGKQVISTKMFLRNWNGVVIIIESTEGSKHPDYIEKRKNKIIRNALLPSIVFVFCITIIFGILTNNLLSYGVGNNHLLVTIITHLIGLFFSLLLCIHELNIKTKFSERLCHISSFTDCNAVTKSKAAKIFGIITWADAGVPWFAGGLIMLLVLPQAFSLKFISLMAILALPYPLFSILYQWLKIKKFCPLCVSVQLILISEFLILYKNIDIKGLQSPLVLLAFVIMATTCLITLFLKLIYLSERENNYTKLELLKIKRDSDIFLHKLKSGEKIDFLNSKIPFVFGDINSNITITIFLSFYCSSCAARIANISALIENNIKAKFQLVFSPPRDNYSIKLLSIVFGKIKSGNYESAFDIIDKWFKFDPKSKLELVNCHDTLPNFEEVTEIINYNTMLFLTLKIFKVPSVLLNGYPLPGIFLFEDIKYHLNELEKMKN